MQNITDRDWTPEFLAALAANPNVTAACLAARVPRSTAYDRRAADHVFAAAWDDAVDQALDGLVGMCYSRAMFDSDGLLTFLLKAHRPAIYGDRSKVDVTSAGEAVQTVIYIPDNGRNDGVCGDPAPEGAAGKVPLDAR